MGAGVSANVEGGAVSSGSTAGAATDNDWPQKAQKRGRSPVNTSVFAQAGHAICMRPSYPDSQDDGAGTS